MKKYIPSNKIWNLPFIAPISDCVSGVKAASVSLANRVKGEWEFLYEDIKDIPSPYCECQNYDFATQSSAKWQSVIAPGSLVMQGFDIKNNVEYYYRRKINIDKSALDKGLNVYLRFEGVYSNSRIWVNNVHAATHVGGFTPYTVEITKYIDDSGECELVVGVSDIEGTNKGVWNAKGDRMSDAAWASYYAHTNVCGILRDITMYYLPKDYVVSQRVNAGLCSNFAKGTLDIRMLLDLSKEVNIRYELLDFSGDSVINKTVNVGKDNLIDSAVMNKVHKLEIYNFDYKNTGARASDKFYSSIYAPYKRCELKGGLYGVQINDIFDDVIAWNAESPYLYTLKVTVMGKAAECVYTEKIGFRQVEYAGANGTDINKMYVNGDEIKLRGVCRHDISHVYGRSVSAEEELQEILAFKRNNVNHIRTSHYPASKNYLKLCDEYGIYVEIENAVCFKGANNYPMLCAPEQIMQNLSEMVEFYYNHPSIVIWSTANESGFEKSCAFRLSYEYVKEQDKSRPTIFSYPTTIASKPQPYDIYSKHYMKVDKDLGSNKYPKLHDEFAHVACYNLADISRDNNYRIGWGESIAKGWDNIWKTDGALGCAIWGGIDEIFYVPSNISVTHQRHSGAQAVGYGEWGSVLDVFKREKPEAFLTKKAFSPIKISNIKCKKVNGSDKTVITFDIENRFCHTNLNQIDCAIIGDLDNILHNSKFNCDVPPRGMGLITLDINTNGSAGIDIALSHNGFEVERETFNIKKVNQSLAGNIQKISIYIDKSGKSVNIVSSGNIMVSGPYLYKNGRRMNALFRKVKSGADSKIVVTESYGGGMRAKFVVTSTSGTAVNVELNCNAMLAAMLGNNYGAVWELNGDVKSVDWVKDTAYSYYPADHIERKCGEATVKAKTVNEYGVKPDFAWRNDSYNYFISNEPEPRRLYVTNDFKTNRTDIKSYRVNLGTEKLQFSTDLSGINAFTSYAEKTDYADCADRRIFKRGNWRMINKHNDKRCMVSRKAGSKLSVEFEGVGVKIYGTRSKEQGTISIYVDGIKIREVLTRSDICDILEFMVLDTVTGLSDAKHLLEIVLNDDKGVRISGVEFLKAGELTTQSYVYINKGKYYRSLAWGNYYGKRLKLSERKQLSFTMSVIKD